MERLVLCPGSWELSRAIEEEETPTRSALEGTLIHEVLAGFRAEEGLTERQAWVVAQSREIVAALELRLDFDAVHPDRRVFIEDRLWYYEDGTREVFSGQVDYAVVVGSRGLIVDYKTGSGPVTATAANYQMRASAVLLAHNYELDEVYVAIVQPLADDPTAVVRYGREDLIRAEVDVLVALRVATLPAAPRIAGDKQCRFCRARGFCPEARAAVLELADLGQPEPGQAVDPGAVERLTGEELASLLPRLDVAEQIIREIRRTARARIESDPASLPGYRLRGGADRRFVQDAEQAWRRLSQILSPEQFAACCTLQLGRAEETVARTNQETLNAARQTLELVLGDLIQRRPSERALERLKGDE